EQLEELTADLLERTVAITRRPGEGARRRGVQDISEIVLVGGMTRMPAVAAQLKKQFGLEIKRHEPDLAVDRGAALYALVTSARRTARVGGGAGGGHPSGIAAAEEAAGTLGISTDQAEEIMSRRVTT